MRTQKFILVLGMVILWWSPIAQAQLSTSTDRSAFLDRYPTHSREGFESLSPGTRAPFTVGGVQVMGKQNPSGPEVSANLLGSPHSFWFQGVGSPENFVMANDFGFEFDWAIPIDAVGFDIQCFACDSEGNPSSIRFEAFDALGNSVGTLDQVISLNGAVRFASMRSAVPFRKLRVSRIRPGGGLLNYMVDDLRFATDSVFASGFE